MLVCIVYKLYSHNLIKINNGESIIFYDQVEFLSGYFPSRCACMHEGHSNNDFPKDFEHLIMCGLRYKANNEDVILIHSQTWTRGECLLHISSSHMCAHSVASCLLLGYRDY